MDLKSQRGNAEHYMHSRSEPVNVNKGVKKPSENINYV